MKTLFKTLWTSVMDKWSPLSLSLILLRSSVIVQDPLFSARERCLLNFDVRKRDLKHHLCKGVLLCVCVCVCICLCVCLFVYGEIKATPMKFSLFFFILREEGQVHWRVNYYGTQSLKMTLSFPDLKYLVLLLIGRFKKLCSNFLTNNFELMKGNFVYQHWGCILIDHPLSYP